MLCSALRSRCLDKKGECLLYFVCRCVFWSALTVAAVWDVREYRIPNGCLAVSLVSGAAAAFGVSGAAFGGMAASSAGGLPFSIVVLSGFLIRFLMVVALGLPVYRWGMIGAGDVKMAAVLAAWLGFKDGAAAISAGFAAGAVLALGKMLRQGSTYQRFLYLSAYIRQKIQFGTVGRYYEPDRDGRGPVIPLGACFFAGAAAIELWQRL